MARSFLKQVQSAPKVVSVKKRIKAKKAELKKLGGLYRRVCKSEGKRIGRIMRKATAARRKKKKRR